MYIYFLLFNNISQLVFFFFFFSSRRRHTRSLCDWSSDVCSSDLECFPKNGTVYHLFSRRLYRQIDRENIRNRREHEIEHIQRRIGILDFVLLNQGHQYLETEPDKVSFFCNQLKVPNHSLPSKIYHGRRTSQPTVRYFVDKFPMFVAG